MEKTHKSYDNTPYQSYPYPQSSPEKLATLGVLFGMQPPKIETARVLELGCAEGGNLIPHAVKNPKGEYIGVDLSKVQITAGQKHVKNLGLKNIELKHCSIMDIDSSYGKFDYIICHGVISWVPEEVQDKIFEISKNNLNKNGIAYISYNTLPGWNMVRTIRDMMLYHSKNFAEAEKVTQSRALLEFVKESLANSQTPYAKVLRNEAEILSQQKDHYIRHDHLEDENKQFYFNDFMQKASSNGLQYLSDCSLSTMYLNNLPPKAAEKLNEINDIVRTEQYMDFITNRRFRSTLLCHSDVKLTRTLSNECAKKFALSLNVSTDKDIKDVDIENSNESIKFYLNGDKELHINTSSIHLKAILYTLIENKGYPINFQNLVNEANKLLKNDSKETIEAVLLQNAMNLVMKGYMGIHLQEIKKVNLEKPKINNMIKHQINETSNDWVTNNLHTAISINFFDKFALRYMDGKNNKKAILNNLVNDAKDGKITLNKDNKPIQDIKEIEKEISAHLDNTISKLATMSVFE